MRAYEKCAKKKKIQGIARDSKPREQNSRPGTKLKDIIMTWT